jgi:hypothetical protein
MGVSRPERANHSNAPPIRGSHYASAAAKSASRVYISGLPWLSASNGLGPAERNRSNGEARAYDGKTISIGNHQYSRGIGAHATSDVGVALDDRYDVFKAVIGVDDEAGDHGSVVFEVGSMGNGLIRVR